jgi:hypothetical protein
VGTGGMSMQNSNPRVILVTLSFLAARWMCSEDSALRACERARLPVIRLTMNERGLRRYRLADVEELERRLGESPRRDGFRA